jgi:hypothetical protein
MKMTKILCVISIFIALLIFTGCSKKELNYTVTEADGIKTYHNKNIPSDPNFKISPKELFTIHGYDESAQDTLRNFIHPHDIAVDSKGNIFVLDDRLSSIKKFDKNGKYLKSIGRIGIGPGEMRMAWMMLVMHDTLYVADTGTYQHLAFDTEGNFIKNINIERVALLIRMTPVTSNLFVSEMESDSIDQSKNEYYYINDFHLRNSKFEMIKSLSRKIGKDIGESTNYHDFITSFGVGRNQIYTAKNSSDEYSIDVLDSSGIILYKIQKEYRRLPLENNELTEYQNTRKRGVQSNEQVKYDIKYKKAINAISMFVDKNGYLLVQVPLERKKENEFDFVVDAFKDGIFINRFKMDIGKAFDFYNSDHKRWFVGNRIYYQNREDNCVTVYEY